MDRLANPPMQGFAGGYLLEVGHELKVFVSDVRHGDAPIAQMVKAHAHQLPTLMQRR